MSRARNRWQVADYRARRLGLSAVRLIRWRLESGRWPRPRKYSLASDGALAICLHSVRVSLLRRDGHADPALEAGKRINLALAAPSFDGLLIRANRPLSFWRALGRVSEARGYTWGMELRGGCVVPSIAGGLCLLSNALFALAARAGWRIVERHGHSLEAIAPLPGEVHLDATVAWPDVDLVIAPTVEEGPVRLEVSVVGDELIVSAWGARASDVRIELEQEDRIETRGKERWRSHRVMRRRLDARGFVLGSELIAESRRRLLEEGELGRTCINCGELACSDRPAEPVLVALGRRQ